MNISQPEKRNILQFKGTLIGPHTHTYHTYTELRVEFSSVAGGLQVMQALLFTWVNKTVT
jgi:hypothetical protein